MYISILKEFGANYRRFFWKIELNEKGIYSLIAKSVNGLTEIKFETENESEFCEKLMQIRQNFDQYNPKF